MKKCQDFGSELFNSSQSNEALSTITTGLSKSYLEERYQVLNQVFYLTEEELSWLNELVETISNDAEMIVIILPFPKFFA